MLKKPLVYIAGPYSRPCPVANTREAMRVWMRLWEGGLVVPVIPHLSMFIDLVFPQAYERWLQYDLELLTECDGLLRMPGESPGADREVAHAQKMKIPVFTDEDQLRWWARKPE